MIQTVGVPNGKNVIMPSTTLTAVDSKLQEQQVPTQEQKQQQQKQQQEEENSNNNKVNGVDSFDSFSPQQEFCFNYALNCSSYEQHTLMPASCSKEHIYNVEQMINDGKYAQSVSVLKYMFDQVVENINENQNKKNGNHNSNNNSSSSNNNKKKNESTQLVCDEKECKCGQKTSQCDDIGSRCKLSLIMFYIGKILGQYGITKKELKLGNICYLKSLLFDWNIDILLQYLDFKINILKDYSNATEWFNFIDAKSMYKKRLKKYYNNLNLNLNLNSNSINLNYNTKKDNFDEKLQYESTTRTTTHTISNNNNLNQNCPSSKTRLKLIEIICTMIDNSANIVRIANLFVESRIPSKYSNFKSLDLLMDKLKFLKENGFKNEKLNFFKLVLYGGSLPNVIKNYLFEKESVYDFLSLKCSKFNINHCNVYNNYNYNINTLECIKENEFIEIVCDYVLYCMLKHSKKDSKPRRKMQKTVAKLHLIFNHLFTTLFHRNKGDLNQMLVYFEKYYLKKYQCFDHVNDYLIVYEACCNASYAYSLFLQHLTNESTSNASNNNNVNNNSNYSIHRYQRDGDKKDTITQCWLSYDKSRKNLDVTNLNESYFIQYDRFYSYCNSKIQKLLSKQEQIQLMNDSMTSAKFELSKQRKWNIFEYNRQEREKAKGKERERERECKVEDSKFDENHGNNNDSSDNDSGSDSESDADDNHRNRGRTNLRGSLFLTSNNDDDDEDSDETSSDDDEDQDEDMKRQAFSLSFKSTSSYLNIKSSIKVNNNSEDKKDGKQEFMDRKEVKENQESKDKQNETDKIDDNNYNRVNDVNDYDDLNDASIQLNKYLMDNYKEFQSTQHKRKWKQGTIDKGLNSVCNLKSRCNSTRVSRYGYTYTSFTSKKRPILHGWSKAASCSTRVEYCKNRYEYYHDRLDIEARMQAAKDASERKQEKDEQNDGTVNSMAGMDSSSINSNSNSCSYYSSRSPLKFVSQTHEKCDDTKDSYNEDKNDTN